MELIWIFCGLNGDLKKPNAWTMNKVPLLIWDGFTSWVYWVLIAWQGIGYVSRLKGPDYGIDSNKRQAWGLIASCDSLEILIMWQTQVLRNTIDCPCLALGESGD